MGNVYFIPDIQNIEKSLELTEKYNGYFEYNDFMIPSVLEDEKKVAELIAFYSGLHRDRSKDTLHGAFLDITVHSDDPLIYKGSLHRVRQSMEIAKQLGIRGVVFHTNFIPNFRVAFYQKNWLEKNEKFWRQMLKEYPELCIFIENMFDEEPDLLAALAERMKDEARFGVCFDYAHACVFGHDIDDWVNRLAPYIRHMHINDNDLKDDLHLTVGEGQIDWNYFTKVMRERGIDASVLMEIKSPEAQEKSWKYIQENKIYPYEKEKIC